MVTTKNPVFLLCRIELTPAGDTMHPDMPTTIYVNEDFLRTYLGSTYIYFKKALDDVATEGLAKAHILSLTVASTREKFDFGNQRAALPRNTGVSTDYLNSDFEMANREALRNAIGSPYTGLVDDFDDTTEIEVDLDAIAASRAKEKPKEEEPPKFIRMRIGKPKEKEENINAVQ